MTASMFYGDCLEVMKTLPDKSVDCFICDLPFGCLTKKHTRKKPLMRVINGVLSATSEMNTNAYGAGAEGFICPWDVKLDIEKFWEEVRRLRKADNTPCIMFTTTTYGIDLINSNPKEFRYDLVWHKSSPVGFLSANIKPMRDHEMIYVFSKKGAYYNRTDIPNGIKARSERKQERKSPGIYGIQYNIPKKDPTARCIASVIFTSSEKGKGIHPTQKPKDLYRWLVQRYCPADGTMLDPTAGSFNSVFTAMEMGRDAIGIEKDEGFFLKAKKRAVAYSSCQD